MIEQPGSPITASRGKQVANPSLHGREFKKGAMESKAEGKERDILNGGKNMLLALHPMFKR